MRRSSETHLHDEVWANIPWVVNERLSGRERERAERHFETCATCRTELDHQRKLRGVVLLETNIEVVPNASLHKLLARIDSGQEPIPVAGEPVEEATVVPFPERVSEISRAKTVRTRWLVAAVVVQAVALTVLASAFVHGGGAAEGDAYRVRSSVSHLPLDTIARVVFASETTSAEMQSLLVGCRLQVTDGPTESGVYSVRSANVSAVAAAVSAESAAACLRTSGAVRFAEPHTE
jgi:hypothetical protein